MELLIISKNQKDRIYFDHYFTSHDADLLILRNLGLRTTRKGWENRNIKNAFFQVDRKLKRISVVTFNIHIMNRIHYC